MLLREILLHSFHRLAPSFYRFLTTVLLMNITASAMQLRQMEGVKCFRVVKE